MANIARTNYNSWIGECDQHDKYMAILSLTGLKMRTVICDVLVMFIFIFFGECYDPICFGLIKNKF